MVTKEQDKIIEETKRIDKLRIPLWKFLWFICWIVFIIFVGYLVVGGMK